MASAVLSEPQVLAYAKQRLFPDPSEPGTYAIVDTQFAKDEWLPRRSISPNVRSVLSPFNHVRLGSGYPDLVGVRFLESDLLTVENYGAQPPLVAVEAKGYTDTGLVDVERGIVQAYDRLQEANATYVAAPVETISTTARTLARELNVGVLGVESTGTVESLEIPRIVGNRTSDDARAIRFQATAQGVADKSFGLNHPKNYLAFPLACYHSGDTNEVVADHVVGAVDSARRGAVFLGLVEERPTGIELTPLGREVIRFALRRYGTVNQALIAFEDWQGSKERFCEIAPEWGLLTRFVVWNYPATQVVVEELQSMNEEGLTEPSLVDLVERLHVDHPAFTVELFLRGTESVRSRALDADGQLQVGELNDGNVYHAPTVFQLKAMLFHAGILTERGAEPHRLKPGGDVWQLREPLALIR